MRPDGLHEDLTDHAKQATSTRMPTAQDLTDFKQAYAQRSSQPDHFDDFLAALSTSSADTQGWSDQQFASITAPTLLVIGDHDFTTIVHAALMEQPIPRSQPAACPAPLHAAHPPSRPRAPTLVNFLD